MEKITLKCWSPKGNRRPPVEFRVPEVFLSAVTKHWIEEAGGAIATVSLADEVIERDDGTEWATLGGRLVRELLKSGQYVALFLTGDVSLSLVLKWMREVAQTPAIGTVGLQSVIERHPTLATLYTQNVTWNMVQLSANSEWLTGVWKELGAHTFIGAELLMAVYPQDVSERLSFDGRDDERTLGASLDAASGWVIPGDGWGYFVGVDMKSDMYARLEVLATADAGAT